ncbi:hypothetical protein JCM10914A_45540 [Paenibacillus sp. JCM 10914]
MRGDNIPKQDMVTFLIHDEIKYFMGEYLRNTGTINEEPLIWILNRVTAYFSLNYFKEWLRLLKRV